MDTQQPARVNGDVPHDDSEGAASPPHSTEAEQSVLGGLLLDNCAWPRAAALITDSDFYRFEHRAIYAAIGSLVNANKPADTITVYEQLKADGHDDVCGGLMYLNALVDSVPSAANILRYAECVRERATLRKLRAVADQIHTAATAKGANPVNVQARAHELLASVAGAFDAQLWPQWVTMMRDWVPAADLATRKVDIPFAVEGWIQRGKVGALVAAGGTGKTTLLLVLAICHALGLPFFGCGVAKGSFVLLSADDSQDDLDGALALVVRAMKLDAAQAATVAAKVRVISLQKADSKHARTFTMVIDGALVTTDLERCVVHAVAGIDDLVGLALDTLRQFSGGSSNDEQVIKLTITSATAVAAQTGAYVVLPHHTGKQNYRDGVTDMYCGTGSAAIADNCRFVLLLQTTTWADIESKVQRTGQERGDPLVLMSTRGSLLVKAPPPMFLYRDGYFIGRVAGAVLTKDQRADERDREVLRAVRSGCQTKSAILSRVRGKREDQFARIDDLEDRGLISNGSQNGSLLRPKYTLSAKGAKWLDNAL